VKKQWKLLLGGTRTGSKKRVDVINPYDGALITRVYQGNESILSQAIEHAQYAYRKTRALPAYARSEILSTISSRLSRKRDDFARALTLESGKTIRDAQTEVGRAVFTFQYAAEEAKRLHGEWVPLDLQESSRCRWGVVRRFPIGVIAGITPSSFPLNLVAHKLAPAIACGNTIVIKPSSRTPTTAIMLGELACSAGLPRGALSVIPCSEDAATALVTDPRVAMVSFSGRADVGWRIKEIVADKRVILELGGNVTAVVHDDCDLDLAVRKCVQGSFASAGQVSVSVQRICVSEKVFDSFLRDFLKLSKQLQLGDPLDPDTDVGPMIDEERAQEAEDSVGEAIERGASLVLGGKRDGTLFSPTILTGTRRDMPVWRKEIIAPLVVVEPYNDFGEALEMVNDSEYGLQAGVFTNDMRLIWHAYEDLDVGIVIANDVPTFRIDHMPYGGVKRSGFGREGIKYAIEEMTEPKLLGANLGD
jgi:glyceraldehyde-3-phosphate dehydrogenase (NADP+)